MKRIHLLSLCMMKSFIAPVVFSFLFSACSVKLPEPAAYNDSLAVQQIVITEKANMLHDAFAGYVKAEMEIRRKDLELQLKKAELEIMKTGAYGEDNSLYEAAAEFLKGFKKLNREEYDEVIRILSKPDSTYSENDEARLGILYKSIDEQSNKLISNFIDAQKEFASKHELTLKKDSDKSE